MAAGLSFALPLPAFTLAWTHSIEKIRWEEDYLLAKGGLKLVAARIRGSGAGMEPPADAVLRDGVWHYRPAQDFVEKLRLTRSAYAADYELCRPDGCAPLAAVVGSVDAAPLVEMFTCPP